MSSSQLKHVRNCETSHEVWTKLASIYASQGPTRKATLLEQLLSQKMREDDDVQDYLSRFMNTVDNLHQMNIDINGDLLSIMLLHSLPNSYNNFCCAIKSRDSLPTVDTLIGKIVEENFAREHKIDDSGGAMFAKQKYDPTKNASGQHSENKQKTGPNNRGKVKCNYCGKTNHKESRCFKKKKTKIKMQTQ